MARTRSARGAGNIGCLLWLVVIVLVGHILWKVDQIVERPTFAV